MQCQDVLNMLSDYLDGALDPAEREAVHIHLISCPECCTELEELKYSIQLLKELPDVTPPAEFRTQLMEKIDRLNASQKATKHSNWFSKVNGISRSTWYRTITVAAVMVMAFGLSSMWDQEGKPLLPGGEPKIDNAIVAVQETQEQNSATGDPEEVSTKVDPNDTDSHRVEPNKPAVTPNTQPGHPGAVRETPAGTETSKPVDRQVESFTPQPSDGLVASSATLKLDVQEIEPTLKSVGEITQNNNGSIYAGFSGSEEAGAISIKVPRKSFANVLGSLQQLGTVITYLPTEKDLSNQHQEAKQRLEQLQRQEEELRTKLAEGQDAQLEKELGEVSVSLQEQINVLKKLEDRSTYSVININFI